MKLNPFNKKSAGYYDKVKANHDQLSRQLAAIKKELIEAEAQLAREREKQTRLRDAGGSMSMNVPPAASAHWPVFTAAHQRVDHLKSQVSSLESQMRPLQHVLNAPEAFAQARKTLDELIAQSKASTANVEMTDTQQFNTTTSMGRLMLNVLLSFAQFEREVTGERIRDKIAASKAKGMWMGGHPPLGYRVEDRRLVVVGAEADLVKRIFTDFVVCRSTTDLVRQLAADGKTNKQGKPFSKQMLYKLLHNRVYRGEIPHKGQFYLGTHEAIIDQALWDAAHAILAENNRQRTSETWQRRQPDALLLGLFYTADGEKYQPAFTKKANGKRYRYYVPNRKVRFGADASPAGRVPAEPIEQMVLAQIHAALMSPEMVQSVWDVARQKCPALTEPEVVLPLRQMGEVWTQLFPAERQRIVQLLIERVTLREEGIEITWRDTGWHALAGEMRPGTIGGELLEMEQQEVMA